MNSFSRYRDAGVQIGLGTDTWPSDMVLNLLTGVIATVRGNITPAHRKAAKDALEDLAEA